MRKLLTILIAASMISFVLPVNAMVLNEADVNFTDNTVTITGEVGSEYANRFVSLQVLNPNKDFANLFTENEVLNRSEQGFVKDDGSFEFTFTMDGDDGDYYYFVGVDGLAQTLECTRPFTYYTSEFISSIWTSLKAAVDTENDTLLKEILEKYPSPLKIDTAAYNALDETAKARIRKGIIRNGVNDINEFSSVFEDAMSVYKLYLEADDVFKAEVTKLFDKAEDKIKKLYDNKLSNEERDAVVQEIRSSQDLYNTNDILSMFKNSVRLKTLNSKVLWAEIDNFITTEGCFFDKEILVYKDSNDKQTVATQLLEKLPYTSIDTFISDLKDFCTPSGAGTGGTGGGGGGIVAVTPDVGNRFPNVSYVGDSQTLMETGFDDLSGFDWALSDILKLKNMGIVSGYNNKFNPGSYVTRAELLKMALLAAEIPTGSVSLKTFSDVSEDDWYAQYVMAAANLNLVSGVGDGRFNPDGNISRQDIAVILSNIFKYKGKLTENSNFSPKDYNEIADYAKDSVCQLMKMGIINGFTDGTFRGGNMATKAEAAALISRFADLIN